MARARQLLGTRAIGHTGTLDPFATGLLVLVLGGATRLARWAEQHRKTYWAEVRLGISTDTDDATGQVIARAVEEWPTAEAVGNALSALVGSQLQRPPAYSAKLISGERSFRLARRGERPEPAPVQVTVFAASLLEYAPPMVRIRAEVSPGTYIRALGRDLGTALGTGAHLTALRRERVGPWSVRDATPLQSLNASVTLLPPEELVGHLPRVELTPDEVVHVRHGRNIQREGAPEGQAALMANRTLVAVAESAPGGWHPAVVLA